MLNRNTANFSKNINSSFLIRPSINNIKSFSSVNKGYSQINEEYIDRNCYDNLKIIGQFDKKFIITFDYKSKNIIMFDQHAVHERILYELFSKIFFIEVENKYSDKKLTNNPSIFKENFSKQLLKIPIILRNFSKQSVKDIVLNKKYDVFNLEFSISKDDEKNIKITVFSVPIILDRVIDEEIHLYSLLEKILKNKMYEDAESNEKMLLNAKDLYLDILKSKGCRNAVKFNDSLNNEVMSSLITNLKTCKNPFICAHGRHNFFILKKS